MATRVAILALLLLLPSAAAATPAVAFEAHVQTMVPVRMGGVVGTSGGHDAFAVIEPTTPEGLSRLVESADATFILHRTAQAHAKYVHRFPGVDLVHRGENRERPVQNLTVDWIASHGATQVLLDGSLDPAFELEAAQCRISPAAQAMPGFGWATHSRVGTAGPHRAPGPSSLEARCAAAHGLEGRFQRVLVYGMELHLRGDDLDETVWTGSQKVPGDDADVKVESPARARNGDAFTFSVDLVQVLEIRVRDAPLEFRMGGRHNATLYGQELHGVGRLGVDAGIGRLHWGELRRQGTLGPVDADGTFSFRRGAHDAIHIQGHTLDGPTPGAASGGVVAEAPPMAVLWLGAGGGFLLLLAGLYARLSRRDVDGHPRRQAILAYVREHPGADVAAIAAALGVRWTKAAYHAARLQEHRLVVLRRVGGRTAVFPAGGYRGQETAFSLLRRPAHRRIHEALRARPHQDQAQVASAARIHRSQASRILAALRRAGLVEVQESTRPARYCALEPSPPVPGP